MTAQQLSPRDAIVLGMISAAIEAGEPCPNNMAICHEIGAGSISTAAMAVQRLDQLGLISVERTSRTRVVTLLATGQRTAPPREARAVRSDELCDRLAELVANGISLVDAAVRMDLSVARIHQLWRRIRDGLGWQAS